jgi:hypothetical protein
MMFRNAVLGLLLANVLVFLWRIWLVPPDAESPAGIGPLSERALVLLRDTAPRPDAESIPASVDDGICTRLGPFADIEMADTVGRQLEGDKFVVRRTSKAGQIWVGYWVQLVDLKTAENAGQVVDRLIDSGLLDAYIFQTEPTINISLGVYRSRKGAERVAGLAREMGFGPEMTDRFQPGVEHWLTVESPIEQVLDRSDIAIGSTQILRTESIACEANAPVSAKIQP